MQVSHVLNKFKSHFPFDVPWDLLDSHYELLKKWNAVTNLVSRGTIQRAPFIHYYDCLKIVEAMIKHELMDVKDIGSGAGFPGMIYSIVTAKPVQLYERIGKKRSFLAATVAEFELKNVSIEAELKEQNVRDCLFTLRAVFQPPEMFEFLDAKLGEGSIALIPSVAPYPARVGRFVTKDYTEYTLPDDGSIRRINVVQNEQ